MSVKINLSEKITDLEGNEMYTVSGGRVLADYLMSASTKEPLRFFKLAIALVDDKEIEISKDDLELLKSVIEGSPLQNIVKSKLLIMLEK